MADFQLPSQYSIEKILIDGEDITGLYQRIELFENIFSTGIVGTIDIFDSDAVGFIEGRVTGGMITFTEPIEFEFVNALDERLIFEGFLSGLREEVVKQRVKTYSIDFISKAVKEDDTIFVTKDFKDTLPLDIIKEMVELIGIEDIIIGEGEPMNFVSGRRKPTQVMRYVCNHACDPQAVVGSDGEAQEGSTAGPGGFLCWETLDGYRFVSIRQLIEEYPFPVYKDYFHQLANREKPLEEKMLDILEAEYETLGDADEQRKAGTERHIVCLYDMDKGEYIELDSNPESEEPPTRYLTKFTENELFNTECKVKKEVDDAIDQTRKVDSQNLKTSNALDFQKGRFILNPRFIMRSGDYIEVSILKYLINNEAGAFDEQHSGKYIIKQVGHHIFADGKAFTKIQTLRIKDLTMDEEGG